ncbi:DUF1127 domain-containing protein [Cereibacter sphaeroides]|uniref:DUF1127 domain-containing protein n=1 Tax=Rhodobacterales TaxID=204455 RepID=UPI000BBED6B3|nr:MULTISPECIES: DUF1127 domain-containing protein [Paracoccaceae]MCE6952943.1 DUF1127 domain-containing protein [Cereibacter sphaeroides]MCE6961959.1 DUF1127 domain-containing protein [Cereibacter sphaeroides]MCE6970734.1 DUF1127 domain-containing protein [Cereibacter sphaeroides]MCE6975670.1 DUF1127 domain-containing protein [Cereibacter sphaeroides]
MTRAIPQTPPAVLNLNRPMPPLARVLFDLGLVVLRWEERRLTRLGLSRLDPHLLRDIGLTRRAAEIEASKPFWRP